MRKVLSLINARQAHHIIPWERRNHVLIQKAASGTDAFHLNEILNGIPLDKAIHVEGLAHDAYNTKVLNKLNQLWNLNGGAAMSTNTAETLVRNFADQLRALIVSKPNTPLNNLIF